MAINPVSQDVVQSPAPAKVQLPKQEQRGMSPENRVAKKEDTVTISSRAEQNRTQSTVKIEQNNSNTQPTEKVPYNNQENSKPATLPSLRGSMTAYTAPQNNPKGTQVRTSA
jgi:hypothetical protein